MNDQRRQRLEQIAGVEAIVPSVPANRPAPLPPRGPPPASKLVNTHMNQSPADKIRDIRKARARGSRGQAGPGKSSRTPSLINRGTLGMTNEAVKSVIAYKDAPGMPPKSITPKPVRPLPQRPNRAGTADPTKKTVGVKDTHDMLPFVKDEIPQYSKPRMGNVPNKIWRKGTPSLKTTKPGILDPQGATQKPKVYLDEKDKERKVPRKNTVSPILTQKVNNKPMDGKSDLKGEMNNELMRKVFTMLDSDGGGHIDAAELQRGLELLQVNSTIGAVKKVMQQAGQGLDGTVDFNTFKEFVGGQMRGGHIGQMRTVQPTKKDENREARISNTYTAKAIGDLRGAEYNNTALFAAGYQRWAPDQLFKPHLAEHERRPKSKTQNAYDKDQARWVKRAQSRVTGRESNMSINSVTDPETYRKQIENEMRITQLRRRLNAGGISPEKQQGVRWGGENRFAAAARISNAREEMHRLDQQSKLEEARKMNEVIEKEKNLIFEQRSAIETKRRAVRKTPTVWNKLIAGEYQHI